MTTSAPAGPPWVSTLQRVGTATPGATALSDNTLAPPEYILAFDSSQFAITDLPTGTITDQNGRTLGGGGTPGNGVSVVTAKSTSLAAGGATALTLGSGRTVLRSPPRVTTTGVQVKNLLDTAITIADGHNVRVVATVQATLVTATQIATMTIQLFGSYSAVAGTAFTDLAAEESFDFSVKSPPFGGSLPVVSVTGAADDGTGKVKLTVGTTSGLFASPVVTVAGVTGSGGFSVPDGQYQATVIDGTHIGLPIAFAGTYTSGGTVTPNGVAGLTISGNQVQIQATGIKAPPWLASEAVSALQLSAANGNWYIARRGMSPGNNSGSGSGPSGTSNGQVNGTVTYDFGASGSDVTVTWQASVTVTDLNGNP